MAAGDLILSNVTLTADDLQKLAPEITSRQPKKEAGDFEEVQSLGGISSLPALQRSGQAWKMVRVALSLLKGLDGTDGTDGREVGLRVEGGYLQWHYAGEASWRNLLALADLKGDTGAVPVLKSVTVENGDAPSGSLRKTGEDPAGNPEYTLSLTVQAGRDGTTPVFEAGTVATGLPDSEVSATLRPDGATEDGHPRYKLDLSVPAGRPGKDGTGAGNVYAEPAGLKSGKAYLFQPGADNSVNGAFVGYEAPAQPTKTSDLENDSRFIRYQPYKTGGDEG